MVYLFGSPGNGSTVRMGSASLATTDAGCVMVLGFLIVFNVILNMY